MDRWLLSGPSLTLEEVAVVLAALLFLTFTPLVFRLVEERRRREERLEALAAESVTGVSPATRSLEAEAPSAPLRASEGPELRPSLREAATREAGLEEDLLWPTTPPPPSLDFWHPDLEGETTTTPPSERSATAGAAREGELAHTTAAHDEHRRLSAAPPAAAEASSTRESALPPSEPAEETVAPVRELPALPPLPAPAGRTFTLLELRRATLPSWPPPSDLRSPQAYGIWRTAEELLQRFSRPLLEHPLSAPCSVASFSLGRVETDGTRYRVHLWLFAELWPA